MNAEEMRRRQAARERIRRKKRKRTMQLLRRIGIFLASAALLFTAGAVTARLLEAHQQRQVMAER